MDWRKTLMCVPTQISYEFALHEGRLHTPELNAPDMAGCIRAFTNIDKNVKLIHVIIGGKYDCAYYKINNEWKYREVKQ